VPLSNLQMANYILRSPFLRALNTSFQLVYEQNLSNYFSFIALEVNDETLATVFGRSECARGTEQTWTSPLIQNVPPFGIPQLCVTRMGTDINFDVTIVMC
jgi:hypothetical protein